MNSFGNKFRITTYGESHSTLIGLVVEGVPAGIKLDLDKIKNDLTQRHSGDVGTTKRQETDNFEITSGIFNGFTTGSAIHIQVKNNDVVSQDYEKFKKHFRPSHADFVAHVKYNGFNDHRGGGIFSGRLTVLLVIAGGIAKQLMPFEFSSELVSVGQCSDLTQLDQYLSLIKQQKDSVGGVVKVKVNKVPAGLGNPPFARLDGLLSMMVMSIPGVKAVSIGEGFNANLMLGSEFNDLIVDASGKTLTNNAGGIVGGISNGNEIVLYAKFKPTSSIQKPQATFNFETNKIEELAIKGRHDVAYIRRSKIIVESVVAIVLANLYL